MSNLRRGVLAISYVEYFQDLRLQRIRNVRSLVVIDDFFKPGASRKPRRCK